MPGMDKTMSEFKAGTLHSGSKSGPTVTSRKQAIAIGLSQERRARKRKVSKKRSPAQTRSMSGGRY